VEKIEHLLDREEWKQRKYKMEPGQDEFDRNQSNFSGVTQVGSGCTARLWAFTTAAGAWAPPS
jgi:hypothetical protein